MIFITTLTSSQPQCLLHANTLSRLATATTATQKPTELFPAAVNGGWCLLLLQLQAVVVC